MDQTFFYIVGGSLVALALIFSMIGLRSESFPSNRILGAGVALMAAVVILAAAAAVSSSGGERDVNAEASANAAKLAATNEEGGGGGSASGTSEQPATPASGQGDDSSTGGTSSADGAQVFADNGCGGCHTLTAASSTGAVGPNLDEALVDKDPTFIKTSIVDPGAEVASGFPDGIMPTTFADQIAPADLDALVMYLAQSTSGK